MWSKTILPLLSSIHATLNARQPWSHEEQTWRRTGGVGWEKCDFPHLTVINSTGPGLPQWGCRLSLKSQQNPHAKAKLGSCLLLRFLKGHEFPNILLKISRTQVKITGHTKDQENHNLFEKRLPTDNNTEVIQLLKLSDRNFKQST